MLCTVCHDMLHLQTGSPWKGMFDLQFVHHPNLQSLKDSANKQNCGICRTVWGELSQIEQEDRNTSLGPGGDVWNFVRSFLTGEWFRPKQLSQDIQGPFIRAYLSRPFWLGQEDLYRLDFKLRDAERIGSFVLQTRYRSGEAPNVMPVDSESTSSTQVLAIARRWIKTCTENHKACSVERSEDFEYPTRLIDLGEVARVGGRKSPKKVRLTKDGAVTDGFYVTLSHCWGNAKVPGLTKENQSEYQQGISVASLPRTFQDAIKLARDLDRRVRYIWIDSLCIMQKERADWLYQSAQMYQIYRNSFCNISATAASNSGKGLFSSRVKRPLWDDEVSLNINGIPGEPQAPERAIKRCKIDDLRFWERYVDDAPVNRRGWVLQERLLAPRVLHFCQGQIAWECRERVETESSLGGYQVFRLGAGDVEPVNSLRSLVPLQGRKVSQWGSITGDLNLDPESKLAVYKCWARIVETYSKTQLTDPGDKLIALSGIANTISRLVDDGDRYVAGMWRKHLESQLLWRVDPVYENGQFYYLSERTKYRAPTFSWAAVEAKRGIKYGEIRDEALLIEVKEVNVSLETDDDKFGVVTGGFLDLSGLLKKIEMNIFKKNGVTRYGWHLKNRRATLSLFKNVYLDSPESDTGILGVDGGVYCMPALDDTDYLICLLLQLERVDGKETGNYRRVGVAKIPHYSGGKQEVIEPWGDEAAVPYSSWDAGKKKHTIRIV